MADIIKLDSNNIVSALHGGFDLGKPYEHKIFLIEVHIAGTTHIENIYELEPELTIGKRVKFFESPTIHTMKKPLFCATKKAISSAISRVTKMKYYQG